MPQPLLDVRPGEHPKEDAWTTPCWRKPWPFTGTFALVCVTENDACGVDAIQCLLGCSAGKGNLILRPVAKHAYAFFDRNSGTALRLCLQKQKDPDQNREQWQQALLTLPLEALFSLSVPAYAVPEPPRLFPTVVCEICGEGAAEHAIRLENGKKVCLDCQQTYARRW